MNLRVRKIQLSVIPSLKNNTKSFPNKFVLRGYQKILHIFYFLLLLRKIADTTPITILIKVLANVKLLMVRKYAQLFQQYKQKQK